MIFNGKIAVIWGVIVAIVYIDGKGPRCNPETSLHILYTFWNGISGYTVSVNPHSHLLSLLLHNSSDLDLGLQR